MAICIRYIEYNHMDEPSRSVKMGGSYGSLYSGEANHVDVHGDKNNYIEYSTWQTSNRHVNMSSQPRAEGREMGAGRSQDQCARIKQSL